MSTELKDVLVATIPSILPGILVGIGILINKNDINRLDGRIDHLEARFDSLGVKVDAVGKQLNDAILMLVNIGNEMDKRISRLEDKRS